MQGRRATALRNGTTTTWTYNDANQPLTESHAGGTLAGLSMNWTYDNYLRQDVATAKNGSTTLQGADYDYDGAGRLQSVTDGADSATYTYQPNSALVDTVTFAHGGSPRLVTTRQHDRLNRLTRIASQPGAAGLAPLVFDYAYNAANQRTRTTLADGSYWIYQYDALGQVLSGRRYWADGRAVTGQQFDYRFDDMGNRDTTGGRASAASDYTANRRNQYTTRTVPAYVDVLGLANPTTNVTVNGKLGRWSSKLR